MKQSRAMSLVEAIANVAVGYGVAVERWQADTGREAILDGDGRTFAQVKTERLGDDADPSADTPDTDAAPEPARKRKTAA